jgi:hypothetical protein
VVDVTGMASVPCYEGGVTGYYCTELVENMAVTTV